jgi:NTP pyrophosphatase (non-canonical NTP hydrolase)
MKELNDKIITWLKQHGIDKLSPDKQYLKIIEEVGELARGLLKNDLEAIKDAIGDIYIALVGYSLQHNIDDIYEGEDNLHKPQKTIHTLRSFIYHLQESYYWMSYYKTRICIVYLEYLAVNEGLSFKECVEHAYNEIKDRDIKIKNGVAVK